MPHRSVPCLTAALIVSFAGSTRAAADELPLPYGFPATLELSTLNGVSGFVINGIDADDYSGLSVSSAGDVNGDGIDDIIIGAALAYPNLVPQAGESYVVFGSPFVGSSGSLELSALDGLNGFVINGIDIIDRSGLSVSSAGDVNGDGIDDIIIGAYWARPNGIDQAGESYVVFGSPSLGSSGSLELSALDGLNGFVINGSDANDGSGWSLSSAGDVNGDGIDDIIIGAYGAGPIGIGKAGESYVVFGGPGMGSSGSLELSALDGLNGFVINGIDFRDFSGNSVSSAGDVNGDGIDDIIIGDRFADSNGIRQAGESYVVFGGPGVGSSGSLELSALDGLNGFVINGIDFRDYSGHSVSSAGDVNGDGIDDIIIGAWAADPNGNDRAGESYVVFGGPGVGNSGSIELSALDGVSGFVINGIDVIDLSGFSVSSAGDVNGDGIDDFIIGAWVADPNGISKAGESYVVFGGPGVGSSGSLELSTLDGVNGFVINGIDVGDFSGHSVSSAGDVNGDGNDDIIIGAHGADPNGETDAGESYVVFGHAPRRLTRANIEGHRSTTSGLFPRTSSHPEHLNANATTNPDTDFNADDITDLQDLALFLSAYPTHNRPPNTPTPPADLNHDGEIDLQDFTLFIAGFGLAER